MVAAVSRMGALSVAAVAPLIQTFAGGIQQQLTAVLREHKADAVLGAGLRQGVDPVFPASSRLTAFSGMLWQAGTLDSWLSSEEP